MSALLPAMTSCSTTPPATASKPLSPPSTAILPGRSNPGRITEDRGKEALKRIGGAERYEALEDCDLVIESAVEDEQVKRKIFAELSKVVKPEALLGTNTSSISVTRLASATNRPEKFMGVHFMNPVPVMPLVELIRGIATDDQPSPP